MKPYDVGFICGRFQTPKLHKMYDELRTQLMSVEYYKNLVWTRMC